MIQFRISVETAEAGLYFQAMPPMPVPRVGEEVFVPGEWSGIESGWWKVTEVYWHLPSQRAMEPTMEVRMRVEWSTINNKPEPRWDSDLGWVRDEEKES